jgi:hypothetical protein
MTLPAAEPAISKRCYALSLPLKDRVISAGEIFWPLLNARSDDETVADDAR